MDADLCVYPALAALSGLYAVALDDNKQRAPLEKKIEPDGTWIEVVVGTAMCLLAAAIRARLEPERDWRAYEQAVWKAFAIGGMPIVIWQLWRAWDRQRRRGDALQQYMERPYEANHERPTTTLAGLRRPGPSTNGTNS